MIKYLDTKLKKASKEAPLEHSYFTEMKNFRALMPSGVAIDECPPLLDPDIASFDEAVRLHKRWCAIVWKPECINSRLYLDGKVMPSLPPKDFHKYMFKSLGNDMPVTVDFIPSIQVIRKLIHRSIQIPKDKIDTMLNPHSKRQSLNRNTNELELDSDLAALIIRPNKFF